MEEKKFVQLTVNLKCGLTEGEAKELFYFLDVNGTGQVSMNEFVITVMPDFQRISDLE
jgi:Ca2+-binding EF-hand superfamily protein